MVFKCLGVRFSQTGIRARSLSQGILGTRSRSSIYFTCFSSRASIALELVFRYIHVSHVHCILSGSSPGGLANYWAMTVPSFMIKKRGGSFLVGVKLYGRKVLLVYCSVLLQL